MFDEPWCLIEKLSRHATMRFRTPAIDLTSKYLGSYVLSSSGAASAKVVFSGRSASDRAEKRRPERKNSRDVLVALPAAV